VSDAELRTADGGVALVVCSGAVERLLYWLRTLPGKWSRN